MFFTFYDITTLNSTYQAKLKARTPGCIGMMHQSVCKCQNWSFRRWETVQCYAVLLESNLLPFSAQDDLLLLRRAPVGGHHGSCCSAVRGEEQHLLKDQKAQSVEVREAHEAHDKDWLSMKRYEKIMEDGSHCCWYIVRSRRPQRHQGGGPMVLVGDPRWCHDTL